MKRNSKLLSGVLLISMIISSLVIPGSYVLASESGLADIFTDPNFLEYVEQFDLDDSGTLSSDEIEKVTRIDCENLGIKSLDGIEIFTNLEELKCGYNELSFLSFPNLPIKVLNVRHNDLYTLDISALTNLQELYCENTALTSLNITSKELKVLVCNDNNIDRIDLSSTKIANVELAIKRFETYVIELKEDVNEYDNSYNFAPDGFIDYKDYLVITDGFTFINGTNVDFSVFDYTPVAFDSENFHDENFLAVLLNQIDYNKNGYLDAFERRNKTSFEIGRVTCDSFDGIQYFPFIKYLGMDDMRIGKMDLSQNSDISSIYIGGSVIGTIDLGDNTALNEFICVDTNISEIDFTGTNYTNLDLEVIHKDGLTIIYDAVTDTDKINHNLRYSFDYKSSFIVVDDSIAIKGLDVEMPELNDIDSVLINQAYFPDEGFRTYLKSEFDKNKDSKLDKDELAKIDALRLRGLGIESLEGIKFFDNLKVIFAADNKLTSLDISNNTKLDSIDVSNNNLTSIDVSNNSSLRKIIAYGNSIKSINLSGTNIDKSDMICEYYGPFLVVRDLPGEYVTLYEYCDECIEIEFGNSIGIFDSVEITGVASISSMPTPPVNAVRPFKINDTIKDSNLQSIIKSFDKNNDGYIEDSENKNINILNCPNRNIASLEGIEKLANLQVLVCNGNPLTEIDVSNNKMLQQINCFSCNLESLTLGDNPELLSIIAYSNKIKSLDISGASKLANLICFSNELDELTISNNTELMTLMVYDNNLKSLDVSGCNKLVQISAYNNELTSLTLGSLSKLSQLLIYGNNLSVIDVSETNLATMALEKTASDYVTTYSDNAEGEKNYSGFVETLEGKADFSAKYSSLIFICDSSATVSDMKEEELGYPEFVDYLYKNVLEREPDENKATYVQQLEDGATGLKLINEFFNSDEFIAACHTNEEYIQILYKSFINQDNNEDGINYWMSRFDEGITREEIFMVFADTIEWKSICESFGVNPGSTDDLLPTTTPEPTTTATPVPTATATPVPTATATPVPTATATPVPTAIATPVPIATTTPVPTVTATLVPTATATPVPTATATPAPTATATPVPTATATPAPTATAIPVPTATATPVPTATATPVPTATATPVPTATATPVPTEVPTVAPTTIPTSEPTAEPTAVPTEKPTVAPTTVPTTEPTPEVELTDTPTPTPEKADVSSFAERLYTTCLGRESEEDGKDYWASELKSGKTGAEVAEGFFFSPEFKEKNLSDEEYIGSLYETFMGRTPADEEVAYWASEMKNGLDRKSVFDGFINSPEWADICLDYGIRSGGLAQPTHEKEASEEVKAFAERLYTTCLGRDSEEAGLKYWSQELANLRTSGTAAASGFFFSPEFINLNLSNEEYVTRLYKTFMGREPEKAGFDYWVGQLNSGASRESVFDGFSAAPEFGDICAEAGIFR